MTTARQITLDGKPVDFEAGETLYEVARRHTDGVPTLCYDERLEPFGGCRLCVVAVEGIAKPVASCTTRAQPGMVVRTHTAEIEKHRKTLIELVASENPAGARIDPLRGRDSQELAQLSVRYEADGSRFLGAQSGRSRSDDPNPMILRDYDQCISCYRCVRVCAEQEGDYAISIENRGLPDAHHDGVLGLARGLRLHLLRAVRADLPHRRAGRQVRAAARTRSRARSSARARSAPTAAWAAASTSCSTQKATSWSACSRRTRGPPTRAPCASRASSAGNGSSTGTGLKQPLVRETTAC